MDLAADGHVVTTTYWIDWRGVIVLVVALAVAGYVVRRWLRRR